MDTLREGSKGQDVKTLQTALNAVGANLVIDGDFGAKTVSAVKDFQKKNKLVVDGIVGPKTWAILLSTPVKPVGKTAFYIGSANVHAVRWGGPKGHAAKVKALKKLGSSIILYQEAESAFAAAVGTGLKHKVYSHTGGYIRTSFNGDKYTVLEQKSYRAPDVVHGGLMLRMRREDSGAIFEVLNIHPRPSSVATEAQKKADISNSLKLLSGKYPAFIGGDFNLSTPNIPSSYKRITPKIDTVDNRGIQSYDAIFASAGVSASSALVYNPGTLSDHFWVRVRVEFSGVSPL